MIETIIEQLHEQLAKHFQPFLNPPATEVAIQQAEKQMGIVFPDDLRALYLTHNGEMEEGPGLFFGLPFLSLEDMLLEWESWKDLVEDEELQTIDAYSVPPAWIKESYANRYWLPISKDYSGNHLAIDLDPVKQGKRGQVINFGRDEEIKYVIAHHITDFLAFITATLQEGPYTIEETDEWLTWSYGPVVELHFLDAIRSMELPVFHPISIKTREEEIQQWDKQLDEQWRTIVHTLAEDSKAFLRKKTFYLMGKNISDLTPLMMCRDARELVLSGNSVRDLEPLRMMASLKKLYLGGNPVEDVTPLAQLEKLQYINLAQTNVTVLQPLTTLPLLTNLDISKTNITDYTPLYQIEKLETVALSILNREQLQAVVKMKTLKQLHLHQIENVSEEDLRLLGNIETLRKLTIEKATFTSLAFLQGNQQLHELTLIDSTIEEGAALAKLKRLSKLELHGTSIVNLKAIAQSASLKTFAGAFDQFYVLKDAFEQKVDFSKMIGEMTEEEEQIWDDYLH
ncbi:SMI1/KNR4 family protein [Sporosarcina sp. FSL K6-1522]|uniref:SMI1/KNR4 family protein n=1 Tax=Sporosarcina sp. FSL K6-1522 TaxID=2921554 RepID=UPI00315A90FA